MRVWTPLVADHASVKKWGPGDRRYLSEATMARLTAPTPKDGVATAELMTA
jgi:putative transposase